MYRFFVSEENIDEAAGRVRIDDREDVNHIRSVLRMKPGEQVLLCSGREDDPVDYLCAVESFPEGEVELGILEKRESLQELPSRIFLYQGLPKADKLESIIQKSVELGVYEIVPVKMQRCVVRLDDKKAAKKTGRWNAIALSAAKQSRRGIVPEVREPESWPESLRQAGELDHVLVPYESAEGIAYTRQVLESIKPDESVGVFIGPEGGFSAQEIEDLKKAGARIITLGHRILRTETAGPAILSMLMLNLER